VSVLCEKCLLSGVGLRPLHLSPDAILLVSYPGELFMRLLKLMILPLVIASLIAGEYIFIQYVATV
jgi:Na+/H+-dicarboxylate symporter